MATYSPLTTLLALLVFALPNTSEAQRIASATRSTGNDGPLQTCLSSLNSGATIRCSGGILGARAGKFTNLDSFKKYAGDLSVGNNLAFSFGEDGANLYSELVAANIHLGWLGYARTGFGALVAASDDSTASTADQFFDGGGNASFFIAFPAYYRFYGVKDSSPGAQAYLSRRIDLYLVTSIGADLPELNTAASDRALVAQVGPQLSLVQNATDESIRLFATLSGGYAIGSGDFYENTGVNLDDFKNHGFGYIQSTLGIDLNGIIRVGASVGTSTIRSIDRPLQLSVQLLPQAD